MVRGSWVGGGRGADKEKRRKRRREEEEERKRRQERTFYYTKKEETTYSQGIDKTCAGYLTKIGTPSFFYNWLHLIVM
jgi:hypothetical protein